MTPTARYQQDLARNDFQPDSSQATAVGHLQRLYDELAVQPEPVSFVSSLLDRFKKPKQVIVKGLYLWGGVGRGKTYLMDTFYDCLPFPDKHRVHFHRYMQSVHQQLKQLKQEQDPLTLIAEEFAANNRVLCFDEFFVADITDAMILSGLLQALFERGVSLVTTSNCHPDTLYENGLQRERFLPAIALLKQYTDVVNVDGGTDYRLNFLNKGEIYHFPLDDAAETGLMSCFVGIASEHHTSATGVEVLGRIIPTRYLADDVAWFDFTDLCEGPRSKLDYIELARLYHTIIISNIPVMDNNQNDAARRFVELIDEFYDRNVNLVISAAAAPHNLYTGIRLAQPFERTASRLQEMQSKEYLAKQHRP